MEYNINILYNGGGVILGAGCSRVKLFAEDHSKLGVILTNENFNKSCAQRNRYILRLDAKDYFGFSLKAW